MYIVQVFSMWRAYSNLHNGIVLCVRVGGWGEKGAGAQEILIQKYEFNLTRVGRFVLLRGGSFCACKFI